MYWAWALAQLKAASKVAVVVSIWGMFMLASSKSLFYVFTKRPHQFGSVFKVDGVEMSPFAAPDEAFFFKGGHHLLQERIAQDGLGVRAWAVFFAAAPLPIVTQASGQCKVNSRAK